MALKELYYNLWCLCVFVAERLLDLLFLVYPGYKKGGDNSRNLAETR